MQKIILHIDFDSFFASCEQQFNPLLRGQPIGVTATNGRNCIIAASREAKVLGIKSPSTTWSAKHICPNIQFVPAHFTKYYEITKKFLSICKDYSPFIELFSLDEVFIDITQTAHLFGGTHGVVTKIKNRIQKEIGGYITVSVGISYNKILAKMASGLQKPNGVVEVTPENRETIYKQAQLTDICGIGERIKLRLNKLGIYSLIDLQNSSLQKLLQEFGVIEGNFLKNVGLGIDVTLITPFTEAPDVKSVGRNYCLPRNEYNKRIVFQQVYELYEEICIKLRRLQKKARAMGFYLSGSDSYGASFTLPCYTNTSVEMFEAFVAAFYKTYSPILPAQWYVRQIRVWSGKLLDEIAVPISLYEYNNKRNKLWQTIDGINDKFGDHTIRNGFLLYADKLTTVPNGWMGDRYERTKLAEESQFS